MRRAAWSKIRCMRAIIDFRKHAHMKRSIRVTNTWLQVQRVPGERETSTQKKSVQF